MYLTLKCIPLLFFALLLILHHIVPQSPGMCAEFAVFPISGIKSVGVGVFGQAMVTALYPNGLTVWIMESGSSRRIVQV
jgi:hypothetical protein